MDRLRVMRQRLPQDLVVDVLVWLPVEKLIQFRRVSKTWRSLIDSTQFRQLHLRRIRSWISTEEQNKFLFGVSVPEINCVNKYQDVGYVAEFDSWNKTLKKTILELHAPCNHDSDLGIVIYGSCDGLLCMGNHHYPDIIEDPNPFPRVVFLWNPYINKHWELPFYPLPASHGHHDPHDSNISYGFGYDELAHDFKVVRWVILYDVIYAEEAEDDPIPIPIPIPIRQEVMVYNLKSNSWTNLDVSQFPYHHSSPYSSDDENGGILVNGALHWMITTGIENLDVAILGLHLGTYKCHRLQLPLERGGAKFRSRLLALEGCLCLLPCPFNSKRSPSLEMWIMKDYGDKDSWTKQIIQLSTAVTRNLCPVAYSEKSTKLFLVGYHGVVWYDSEKGDWVLVPFVVCGIDWDGFQFVGSLIEPFPCSGTTTSTCPENTGFKRVEANLLFHQQLKLNNTSGSICICGR